eukprot:CAMPEP_0119336748 /NCGR_PEP_ID=MMETSP1333-20130426/92468_1 /TAXON_ID=418940 /ORGANISM="Scyphosphaera apsteinii, Strain RCC1455" /LENGTH=156 /DNA_ID=CAMNT_0007347605 /DNA_START=1 /DNA_END=467 /DNA_ORIENTATION=-
MCWTRMFAVHRGQHKQVTMLAQLLADLSLLSPRCSSLLPSLVASAALCLALAGLRCGLWRDGAPGAAATAEQYWTPSMHQATGYSRDDLLNVLPAMQSEHTVAHSELCRSTAAATDAPPPGDSSRAARYAMLRRKFSRGRFLGVLQVPPFAPHAGG